jgi:hypothetical protein
MININRQGSSNGGAVAVQATESELEATLHIVHCLIGRQTGHAEVADDARLGQLGITDSPESLKIFTWRIFDAFFVDLEPHEMSSDSTVAQIASLVDARKVSDQWGLTPVQLFLSVRRALTARYKRSPELVRWDNSAYEVHRSMKPARRFSLARIGWGDWGYDDLLETIDADLGRESHFMDSIWYKADVSICGDSATVGCVVNYLWRLRISEEDRPTPRFPVHRPGTVDKTVITDAARANLIRLLVVMGEIENTTVEDHELLDTIFIRARHRGLLARLPSKRRVNRMRCLLEPELRATFGVGRRTWRVRVFGNTAPAVGLSPKIRTFGDLVTYVVNGWSDS